MEYRVGLGQDCHRLGPGRPLVLGGVRVDHDRGLVGHSDADVLLHAITDAVLGAAGLGDIGEHFPDTDERHRGADSAELLGIETAAVNVKAKTGEQVGPVGRQEAMTAEAVVLLARPVG